MHFLMLPSSLHTYLPLCWKFRWEIWVKDFNRWGLKFHGSVNNTFWNSFLQLECNYIHYCFSSSQNSSSNWRLCCLCRNSSYHELFVPRKLKFIHGLLSKHDRYGYELWADVRLVVLLGCWVCWRILYVCSNTNLWGSDLTPCDS